MYSSNASPSFLSTTGMTIDQKQIKLGTTVDAQAFGRFINNPMAVNIHDQPLRHEDFSNIRLDSHTTMDIDCLMCEMRPQSDLAESHSSGGQPPSIGDVRQMVVSEPSGSNQMSSDGQPPSVNDVGRREPSQSEASCNRYEGPDVDEVQQVISQLDDGSGAVGRSNAKVFQSFRFPDITFNSIDLNRNYGALSNGAVWAPPPQPFQRVRTYTRVYKRGAVGRSIDITRYSGYDELKQDLARMFCIEGQLEDRQRIGWKLVFVDHENDVILVGGDPWEEFVACVRSIKILSPQEVQQMGLDGDFGGNSVLPNQACSSSVVGQFNGRLSNFF